MNPGISYDSILNKSNQKSINMSESISIYNNVNARMNINVISMNRKEYVEILKKEDEERHPYL